MKSYIEGMTECLRKIEKLEKVVDTSVMTPEARDAIERVGRIGWATWHTALAELEPIDDGVNDTVVDSPVWEGRELVIRGHGSNCLFVEFGTGVHKNYSTKYGQQFGFTPASWSVNHAGWLVGARRKKFKGWWILPKSVVPENTSGAQYDKTVTRTWFTKKYGWRTKTYHYHSDKPYAYWAEGHRPVNGMYKAMKAMQSRDTMEQFAIRLLK